MLSINRVVALLTPVFTAVAAIGSGYIARHLGITFSTEELVAIEGFAATAALTAALKWLHGHQKLEADLRSIEEDILQGYIKVEQLDPTLIAKAREEADRMLEAARAEVERLLTTNHVAIAAKSAALDRREEDVTSREVAIHTALKPFADPNLVLPDQADITPQSETQPVPEPDVAPAAPVEETQPIVLPNAPTLSEQTQQS